MVKESRTMIAFEENRVVTWKGTRQVFLGCRQHFYLCFDPTNVFSLYNSSSYTYIAWYYPVYRFLKKGFLNKIEKESLIRTLRTSFVKTFLLKEACLEVCRDYVTREHRSENQGTYLAPRSILR
jgi:hypothetical protein